MKKILLSLTAAAALAGAAAPAAAQSWRDHAGYGVQGQSSSEIRTQEWRIREAARQGRISRGEAGQLMDELNQLRPVAWRLENRRWNNWDYQQLARGLGHVQAQLNVFASRRDDRYAWRDHDGYRRDWRR